MMRSDQIPTLPSSITESKIKSMINDKKDEDSKEVMPLADAQERFLAMKESTLLRRPVRKASVEPDDWQQLSQSNTATFTTCTSLRGVNLINKADIGVDAQQEENSVENKVKVGMNLDAASDHFEPILPDRIIIHPRWGHNSNDMDASFAVEAPTNRFSSFAANEDKSLLRRPVRQASVQPMGEEEEDYIDYYGYKSIDDHHFDLNLGSQPTTINMNSFLPRNDAFPHSSSITSSSSNQRPTHGSTVDEFAITAVVATATSWKPSHYPFSNVVSPVPSSTAAPSQPQRRESTCAVSGENMYHNTVTSNCIDYNLLHSLEQTTQRSHPLSVSTKEPMTRHELGPFQDTCPCPTQPIQMCNETDMDAVIGGERKSRRRGSIPGDGISIGHDRQHRWDQESKTSSNLRAFNASLHLARSGIYSDQNRRKSIGSSPPGHQIELQQQQWEQRYGRSAENGGKMTVYPSCPQPQTPDSGPYHTSRRRGSTGGAHRRYYDHYQWEQKNCTGIDSKAPASSAVKISAGHRNLSVQRRRGSTGSTPRSRWDAEDCIMRNDNPNTAPTPAWRHNLRDHRRRRRGSTGSTVWSRWDAPIMSPNAAPPPTRRYNLNVHRRRGSTGSTPWSRWDAEVDCVTMNANADAAPSQTATVNTLACTTQLSSIRDIPFPSFSSECVETCQFFNAQTSFRRGSSGGTPWRQCNQRLSEHGVQNVSKESKHAGTFDHDIASTGYHNLSGIRSRKGSAGSASEWKEAICSVTANKGSLDSRHQTTGLDNIRRSPRRGSTGSTPWRHYEQRLLEHGKQNTSLKSKNSLDKYIASPGDYNRNGRRPLRGSAASSSTQRRNDKGHWDRTQCTQISGRVAARLGPIVMETARQQTTGLDNIHRRPRRGSTGNTSWLNWAQEKGTSIDADIATSKRLPLKQNIRLKQTTKYLEHSDGSNDLINRRRGSTGSTPLRQNDLRGWASIQVGTNASFEGIVANQSKLAEPFGSVSEFYERPHQTQWSTVEKSTTKQNEESKFNLNLQSVCPPRERIMAMPTQSDSNALFAPQRQSSATGSSLDHLYRQNRVNQDDKTEEEEEEEAVTIATRNSDLTRSTRSSDPLQKAFTNLAKKNINTDERPKLCDESSLSTLTASFGLSPSNGCRPTALDAYQHHRQLGSQMNYVETQPSNNARRVKRISSMESNIAFKIRARCGSSGMDFNLMRSGRRRASFTGGNQDENSAKKHQYKNYYVPCVTEYRHGAVFTSNPDNLKIDHLRRPAGPMNRKIFRYMSSHSSDLEIQRRSSIASCETSISGADKEMTHSRRYSGPRFSRRRDSEGRWRPPSSRVLLSDCKLDETEEVFARDSAPRSPRRRSSMATDTRNRIPGSPRGQAVSSLRCTVNCISPISLPPTPTRRASFSNERDLCDDASVSERIQEENEDESSCLDSDDDIEVLDEEDDVVTCDVFTSYCWSNSTRRDGRKIQLERKRLRDSIMSSVLYREFEGSQLFRSSSL